MDRGKIIGGLLCLAAVAGTILFLWGLMNQAYWALAIPIGAGVVVAMTLLFWVGWTFISTDVEPPDGPLAGPRRPRR